MVLESKEEVKVGIRDVYEDRDISMSGQELELGLGLKGKRACNKTPLSCRPKLLVCR